MAEVKFIRGDGEEYLAEPGSAAFELMSKDTNFTMEEVTYTEAEAIEQNGGLDESSAAKEASATEGTESAESTEAEAAPETVVEAAVEAPAEKKTAKGKGK